MTRYLSSSISQNAVDRASIVAAGWLLFARNGVTVFDDVTFFVWQKEKVKALSVLARFSQ